MRGREQKQHPDKPQGPSTAMITQHHQDTIHPSHHSVPGPLQGCRQFPIPSTLAWAMIPKPTNSPGHWFSAASVTHRWTMGLAGVQSLCAEHTARLGQPHAAHASPSLGR